VASKLKNGSARMSEIYQELRLEIELLTKAAPCKPEEQVQLPDPITLSIMERRVLVKSIFSFIEALSYSMKAVALDSDNPSLTYPERMLAAEEVYDLDSSGQIEKRRAKLRTISNIRFSFELLAKASEANFNLDVSQKEWHLLQQTLKVRDRLMHPKIPSDLNVSDGEIRDALRAFIWFEKQITLILLAIVDVLQKQVADLRKENGS
jgi:hypothetical protein